MRKLLFSRILIVCILLLLRHFAYAQTINVTGKVIDSATRAGLGLTSIQDQHGKTLGIASEDGNFSVKAVSGTTLVFSYQGYHTTKLPVSSDFMTVILSKNEFDKENQDVVVVAMDIKRNTRELGYSTQTVSGDDIQHTQRQNFITGLQGRVAGLQINPTSGMAGASAQIILRGFNSLSLNNQPLFVIDGVIVDNSTFNETSNGGSGIGLASDRANRTGDYNNRIADINPNDIASVTVLKGPEATALYGSQGGSGAIVITTKRPVMNGKVVLNYNDNFQASKQIRFVNTVNDYSPGSNGLPATASGVPTVNNIGTYFSYFGPKYPDGTKTYDNLHDFFQTGFAQTHNLSADFGKKNVGFRLSGTYFDQTGVIPENTYKKGNISLTNTTKIGKIITITPGISYTHSETNAPLRGPDGLLYNLYRWPVTDNMSDYLVPGSSIADKKTLYISSNKNYEFDNPYWFTRNVHQGSTIDRFIATLGIDIRPVSWLLISGRFGYDTYKDNGYEFQGPETWLLPQSDSGYLDNYYKKYKGYNHTINVTANKKFGKFTTRLMVGTMWQDLKNEIIAVSGSGLRDSLPSATDSSNTDPIGRTRLLRQQMYGLPNLSETAELAYYGEAVVGYNNVIFLDFTERFETSSVFPKAFRNYHYPGLSLSMILSDMIPDIKSQNGLTFAKLRASLANVAHVAPAYSNQTTFVQNFASSTLPISYSYGYTGNNFYLKPEFQHTFDIGTDLRFWNDRISFSADYYNNHNTNQISAGVRESYGSGFVLNTLNAIDSRVEGLELTLSATPVQNKNWTWNFELNFDHTWSKVLSLPAAIDSLSDYYNSDSQVIGDTRSAAVRGYPVTEITGYDYKRNDNGQILIDPNSGLAEINEAYRPIGDRNPTFTLGVNNNISFKNWSLSMLWDIRVGGAIMNGTDMYLTSIGRSERTADRMKPVIMTGVLDDGLQNSNHPTPNNISVIPYYTNQYYTISSSSAVGGMPASAFLQKNVNAAMLRDITISYTFNKKIFGNFKAIKSLTAFATGNNLVLLTNYKGADPYVNLNTAGESGVGGFGMDYLVPSSPAMYSFGIRLNF